MGLSSSVLSQTISEVKAKIKIVSYIVILQLMIILIEIPLFLSLLVSFHKDCLLDLFIF